MVLSNRMMAVVEMVRPCNIMADIGCDHGYVAIELVNRGICKKVIAMDINKGPLERASKNIRENNPEGKIETRLSNGTKALKIGEVDGIICAGMGGKLVISILEAGKEQVSQMSQIILQPQSEIDEVRLYLRSNGFQTLNEDMVFEDGKYYPMMRVCPKISNDAVCGVEDADIQRVFDKYGCYLLKNANPVLRDYLLWQRKGFADIRENLLNQIQVNKRQTDRIEELDIQIKDIDFCINNYYQQ